MGNCDNDNNLKSTFADAGIEYGPFIKELEEGGLSADEFATVIDDLQSKISGSAVKLPAVAILLRAVYLQSNKDPKATYETLNNTVLLIERISNIKQSGSRKEKAKNITKLLATAPAQFSRLNKLLKFYLGTGIREVIGNLLFEAVPQKKWIFTFPKFSTLSPEAQKQKALDNVKYILRGIADDKEGAAAGNIGELVGISKDAVREISKTASKWLEDGKNAELILKELANDKEGADNELAKSSLTLFIGVLRAINNTSQHKQNVDRIIDFIELVSSPEEKSLADWWQLPQRRAETRDGEQKTDSPTPDNAEKQNDRTDNMHLLANPKTHMGAAVVSTGLAAWVFSRGKKGKTDDSGKPVAPNGWKKAAKIISGLALLALAVGFTVTALCAPNSRGSSFIERYINGRDSGSPSRRGG